MQACVRYICIITNRCHFVILYSNYVILYPVNSHDRINGNGDLFTSITIIISMMHICGNGP